MPLTRSQDEMRDAVYRTADLLAFTDKYPSERVNDLLNQGLGALSRICRTTNPEFQPIASTTITTDGVATEYDLPAGFRSLLSVAYTDGDERKKWLTPYEMHERASLTTPETQDNALRATGYKILGSTIELLPRAPANHTALVWYATTVTQLAGSAELFDTMERLDSYVIWWAARELSMEGEAWERYDRLSARLGEMDAEIRILARSIDLSHPPRVVQNEFAGWPRVRRRFVR